MDLKIGKRLEWIWKLGRNRGEFKNCREIWRIQKSQRNRYGLKKRERDNGFKSRRGIWDRLKREIGEKLRRIHDSGRNWNGLKIREKLEHI